MALAKVDAIVELEKYKHGDLSQATKREGFNMMEEGRLSKMAGRKESKEKSGMRASARRGDFVQARRDSDVVPVGISPPSINQNTRSDSRACTTIRLATGRFADILFW